MLSWFEGAGRDNKTDGLPCGAQAPPMEIIYMNMKGDSIISIADVFLIWVLKRNATSKP
jgi:hypothetical protein